MAAIREIIDLPLPSRGKIDDVIHISDVHIPFFRQTLAQAGQPLPSSSSASSVPWKIEQHRVVIDRLVRAVWGILSVKQGRAVVLIAGDVFDCKHTANATTVSLLHDLIVGLSTGCCPGGSSGGEADNDNDHNLSLLPVYVTPGNHDLCLEEEEDARTDLLGTLLAPLTKKFPVAYMNETGIYGERGGGALFGVLHIRDAMRPGNCSGDVRPLEDMPLHKLSFHQTGGGDDEIDRDVRIFVYHGQVLGHRTLTSSNMLRTDDHSSSSSPMPNVPSVAAYHGYDVCMLGDVHTMQLHGVTQVRDDDDDNTSNCPFASHAGTFAWDMASSNDSSSSSSSGIQKTKQNKKVRVQRSCAWAYAGSLMQLNAGERLFPHGFLHWDLRARRVHALHVHSPSGIMFCSVVTEGGGGGVTVHNSVSPLCDAGVPEPVTYDPVTRPPPDWLPPRAVVRCVGGNVTVARKDYDDLREALSRCCGVQVIGENKSGVLRRDAPVVVADPSSSAPESSSLTSHIDLSRFGKPDAWIEYIEDEHARSSAPDGAAEDRGGGVQDREREWLRRPDTLRLPLSTDDQTLPEYIVEKIKERNAKISKKCAEFYAGVQDAGGTAGVVGESGADASSSSSTTEAGDVVQAGRHRFSIRALRWSWMLCFGEENAFSFDRIAGRVALLSAPNGFGKSSVLETLCIALYGQPMPSRGGKGTLSDAIFRWRPKNSNGNDVSATCSVDVSFSSMSSIAQAQTQAFQAFQTFRISRTFSVATSTGKLTSTARVSKLVPPNNTLVTVKDGISAVNAWTSAHVGTLPNFLLCSLLTQNGDADFFGMKPADQRGLLDEALKLDVARSASEILKEARLAHASASDAIQTAIDAGDKTASSNITSTFGGGEGNDRSLLSDVVMTRASQSEEDMEAKIAEFDAASATLHAISTRTEALRANVAAAGVLDEEDDDSEAEDRPDGSGGGGDGEMMVTRASIVSAEEAYDAWKTTWPQEVVTLAERISPLSPEGEEEGDEESSHRDDFNKEMEAARQEAVDLAAERELAEERVRETKDRLRDLLSSAPPPTPHLFTKDVAATAKDLERQARELEEREREAEVETEEPNSGEDPPLSTEELTRLFEKTKQAMTRSKEAKVRLEAARTEHGNVSVSDGSVYTDGVEKDENPPPGPSSRDFEREHAEWEARRENLFSERIRKQPSLQSLVESKDNKFDVVFSGTRDLIRHARDVSSSVGGALRRAMAWQSFSTEKGDENGDEEDERAYAPGCAACERRRSFVKRSAIGDEGGKAPEFMTAIRRVMEAKVRLDAASSSDAELTSSSSHTPAPEVLLALFSSLCETLIDMERWERACKAASFSSACGSSEVIARWEADIREKARFDAWHARRVIREVQREAEEASAEAREIKQRYQNATSQRERWTERKARADNIAYIERKRTELAIMQERLAEAVAFKEYRDAIDDASVASNAAALEYESRESSLARAEQRVSELERQNERDHLDSGGGGGSAASVERFRQESDERRAGIEALKAGRREWKRRIASCHLASEEAEKEAVTCRDIVNALAAEVRLLTRNATRFRMAAEEYERWCGTRDVWIAYRDEVESRRIGIERLANLMTGFTAWVYTCRAIPALVAEVNALLASMNIDLCLDGNCKAEDGGLAWSLNGTPLPKCSGMQRFAASLAMRIAMSQLGACAATCDQLIIDEGFATLDADNISHVPQFLHEGILYTGRYTSVLLVSHLDGVREAADVVIPITLLPNPPREGGRRASRLFFP